MFVSSHFIKAAGTLAALAACAAFAPSPAVAEDRPVVINAQPDTARTERVALGGIDLTSAAGRKRLNFRVAGAVERVCHYDLGRDGLQDRGYYSCADNAWSGASPQIANAIARAEQIAMSGSSSIAATAITVSAM